jgi:hypothetical protein
MPIETALLTLLHLLVFVYWLGGDLGAFYSSSLLTDHKQTVGARTAAAKVLANVDMAPRMGLLLAFPTGMALATAKGWWAVGWAWTGFAFVIALGWIMLAWLLHLNHGQSRELKMVDLVMRIGFLAGLVIAGMMGVAGSLDMPLFIALKMLVLAFAIGMGLLIRWRLTPFGPAFATMITDGPSTETDAVIRQSVGGAKPFVICIWLALITAAWLGIATPT